MTDQMGGQWAHNDTAINNGVRYEKKPAQITEGFIK